MFERLSVYLLYMRVSMIFGMYAWLSCVRARLGVCVLACLRACVRYCVLACLCACVGAWVYARLGACVRACVRACVGALVSARLAACMRGFVCAWMFSRVGACARACVSGSEGKILMRGSFSLSSLPVLNSSLKQIVNCCLSIKHSQTRETYNDSWVPGFRGETAWEVEG